MLDYNPASQVLKLRPSERLLQCHNRKALSTVVIKLSGPKLGSKTPVTARALLVTNMSHTCSKLEIKSEEARVLTREYFRAFSRTAPAMRRT